MRNNKQETFEKLTKMIDQFVADHNYLADSGLKDILVEGANRIQKYIDRQNRYIGE